MKLNSECSVYKSASNSIVQFLATQKHRDDEWDEWKNERRNKRWIERRNHKQPGQNVSKMSNQIGD